jgi:hypothetical protein
MGFEIRVMEVNNNEIVREIDIKEKNDITQVANNDDCDFVD